VRRTARALAAVAAASLAVPLWAVPAHAETLTRTASLGAYYLSTNPGNVGGGVLPIGGQRAPDSARSADGVAEDDLAVAVVAAGSGMPDKFSALQFDLFELPTGATVSKATVVVPLSENPQSRSTATDPTLVVACLAGPQGFGDADGAPFQDAPSAECGEASAQATSIEGGKAFEFDITPIAQKWTETLNTGLVLFPSEAGFGRPFQTVFTPKDQARLTLAFTAPAEDDVPLDTTTTTDTSFDDTATFDTGGSGSAGFDSGSFDSGTSSFDSGSASFGSIEMPAVASADTPTPSVADETPAVAQPVVRTAAPAVPMAFDAATWAALLAGAVLLGVVSLALGAPASAPAAAGTAARAGGVASALARRRAGLASGLSSV
jgi:hypothetical protein